MKVEPPSHQERQVLYNLCKSVANILATDYTDLRRLENYYYFLVSLATWRLNSQICDNTGIGGIRFAIPPYISQTPNSPRR